MRLARTNADRQPPPACGALRVQVCRDFPANTYDYYYTRWKWLCYCKRAGRLHSGGLYGLAVRRILLEPLDIFAGFVLELVATILP